MKPICIVLDTNVCLDLFVFHDLRWKPLYDALKNGIVIAVTREDCRNEWLRVLDYPNLRIDPDFRILCAEEFDALVSCINPASRTGVNLPVCSDRDDQKFLEVARDALATYLITKDKALLKLSKKISMQGMFRIVRPQEWLGTSSN